MFVASLDVALFTVESAADAFAVSLVGDTPSPDDSSAVAAGISTSPVPVPMLVGSTSVVAGALAFDFDLEGDEEREGAAGGGAELSVGLSDGGGESTRTIGVVTADVAVEAAAAAAALEGFAFAFFPVPDFESLSESLLASAPSLVTSFADFDLDNPDFFLVGVVVALPAPPSVAPAFSPGTVEELASPDDADGLEALGLSSISLNSEVESLAFSITARLLEPLPDFDEPLAVLNGDDPACFLFVGLFVRGPASDESGSSIVVSTGPLNAKNPSTLGRTMPMDSSIISLSSMNSSSIS